MGLCGRFLGFCKKIFFPRFPFHVHALFHLVSQSDPVVVIGVPEIFPVLRDRDRDVLDPVRGVAVVQNDPPVPGVRQERRASMMRLQHCGTILGFL